MKVRALLVAVALVTSTAGVAACGSGSEGSNAAAGTASAGAFDDADVMFLQSMIPHHEQAVEMAELALDPKSEAGAKVLDLAERVQAAQDPEITQMKQWLTAWGKPTRMDMSDGHDMSTMDGMMSDADMQALDAATGPAFDELWSTMMIEHHQGAITMAKTVKTEGTNPEVAKLADRIIAAQQAEIAEMNGLLKR